MFHHSTALEAEAQPVCAQAQTENAGGIGQICRQPWFTPVLRRHLMGALATLTRDLGIRPATLAVLDALLSFIPCKDKNGHDAPVTPNHLLTIYAANDTIGFRARGLTDRQLRRHFEILERKGLLCRRDSANGKRFPIYKAGKVTGAYGLDLSPLFARSGELLAQAAKQREAKDETRGIVAQILQLRRRLLGQALPETMVSFVESLRNLTRRVSLTLAEATNLLQRLQSLDHTQSEPPAHSDANEMPACDGQNVRHIKQRKSDSKKYSHLEPQSWNELKTLKEYYPEEPQNAQELQSVLHSCALMLRIDQVLWQKALSQLHPLQIFQVFDQMLAKAMTIQQPNGYFAAFLKATSGNNSAIIVQSAQGHFSRNV